VLWSLVTALSATMLVALLFVLAKVVMANAPTAAAKTTSITRLIEIIFLSIFIPPFYKRHSLNRLLGDFPIFNPKNTQIHPKFSHQNNE
jgi:hypothetical protein